MIAIRKATVDDVDEIIDLFVSTVKTVNSRDYTAEQIAAWTQAKDRNIWCEKIEIQHFYVAMIDYQMGFSSIDNTGYVDFMYVHKDFQGRGIAKSLLDQVEQKARELRLPRMHSSVSITAQPFFKSKGFEAYDKEYKSLNGIEFTNALMQKVMTK